MRGWPRLDLHEMWRYRGLFGFLVWRDIKIRYAQTALGVVWVVLQPVGTMVIFAVVFGRVARVPSDGVSYPAFALVGLVAWSFFAVALNGAAHSLVEQANVVAKVYFPRLFVPLAPVASGLLDAGIALALLVPVLALFGQVPRILPLLAVPVFFLLGAAAAVGIGAVLAALNARYRDFRYLIPFMVQGWLFASPVVYPTSLVPAGYRTLFALNPMVGVIEGCRWAILGAPAPDLLIVAASTAGAFGLFLVGCYYFRWSESTLVDFA